jgi:DNA-directed RNA polymerase subunit RPC12/RpoP
MFRLEQEAEDMSARLYAESQEGLENRCAGCGALGSLEEQEDGAVRCVDCDVVVAQRSKLGGFGRK